MQSPQRGPGEHRGASAHPKRQAQPRLPVRPSGRESPRWVRLSMQQVPGPWTCTGSPPQSPHVRSVQEWGPRGLLGEQGPKELSTSGEEILPEGSPGPTGQHLSNPHRATVPVTPEEAGSGVSSPHGEGDPEDQLLGDTRPAIPCMSTPSPALPQAQTVPAPLRCRCPDPTPQHPGPRGRKAPRAGEATCPSWAGTPNSQWGVSWAPVPRSGAAEGQTRTGWSRERLSSPR